MSFVSLTRTLPREHLIPQKGDHLFPFPVFGGNIPSRGEAVLYRRYQAPPVIQIKDVLLTGTVGLAHIGIAQFRQPFLEGFQVRSVLGRRLNFDLPIVRVIGGEKE